MAFNDAIKRAGRIGIPRMPGDKFRGRQREARGLRGFELPSGIPKRPNYGRSFLGTFMKIASNLGALSAARKGYKTLKDKYDFLSDKYDYLRDAMAEDSAVGTEIGTEAIGTEDRGREREEEAKREMAEPISTPARGGGGGGGGDVKGLISGVEKVTKAREAERKKREAEKAARRAQHRAEDEKRFRSEDPYAPETPTPEAPATTGIPPYQRDADTPSSTAGTFATAVKNAQPPPKPLDPQQEIFRQQTEQQAIQAEQGLAPEPSPHSAWTPATEPKVIGREPAPQPSIVPYGESVIGAGAKPYDYEWDYETDKKKKKNGNGDEGGDE